jgi:hypothetical protein
MSRTTGYALAYLLGAGVLCLAALVIAAGLVARGGAQPPQPPAGCSPGDA